MITITHSAEIMGHITCKDNLELKKLHYEADSMRGVFLNKDDGILYEINVKPVDTKEAE